MCLGQLLQGFGEPDGLLAESHDVRAPRGGVDDVGVAFADFTGAYVAGARQHHNVHARPRPPMS